MTWTVKITAYDGDSVEVTGLSTFEDAMETARDLAKEDGPLKSVEVSR